MEQIIRDKFGVVVEAKVIDIVYNMCGWKSKFAGTLSLKFSLGFLNPNCKIFAEDNKIVVP